MYELKLNEIIPEDISYDYVEKALMVTSFIMDEEGPSLAFIVDDDGYVQCYPSDRYDTHTRHLVPLPFGKAGLPKGLRNMVIESEADYNDYKSLLYEAFPDLNDLIEEAYSYLTCYEDREVGFDSYDSYFDSNIDPEDEEYLVRDY